MAKDLHKLPFDEGTKAKLSIFQDYIKEWLPVFIARKEIIWKTINVFDFFSGPGSDIKGNKGTPLIIIDQLNPYIPSIKSKNLRVNLYFNEYVESKKNQLVKNLVSDDLDKKPYMIKVESKEFRDAFQDHYPTMIKSGTANLLLLDQSGIKQINEDIFKQIIEIKTTDFLFFISSSTIKRFSEHPSIAQYIKLSVDQIEKTPYHQIHRLVLEYYRSLIPKDKDYYLASFSLKKNAGIYGIIFGSGHVLGIEKFLTTSWNNDPERGEANFDIDDDKIIPGQTDLFSDGVRKPRKVDFFENQLKENILQGKLITDRDVYLFTLRSGFLPSHARKLIKKLIDDKKIITTKLNLTHHVCKTNAQLTPIKLAK